MVNLLKGFALEMEKLAGKLSPIVTSSLVSKTTSAIKGPTGIGGLGNGFRFKAPRSRSLQNSKKPTSPVSM